MRELALLLILIGVLIAGGFGLWRAFDALDGVIEAQKAAIEKLATQTRVTEAVAQEADQVARERTIIIRETARAVEAFPLVVNDDGRLLAELGASLDRVRDAAGAAPGDDPPDADAARPDRAAA